MKIKIVCLVLILCIYLCSCGELGPSDKYKKKNYTINCNTAEWYDGSTSRLILEQEEQRFIWEFKSNKNDTYGFSFYYLDGKLSDDFLQYNEFVFVNSNNEVIEFKECNNSNKIYSFVGSETIYIYYNNASDELKTSIEESINHNRSTLIQIFGCDWWF